VALLFSAAFGAMLLSRVLWAQDVWHWSPLTTGLSVAPGPLMVPLFSFLVAGRLTARFGAGPVIAARSTIFAAGAAWWALAIGLPPDYAGELLGGMLLTGIGVGLTLPTLMATEASPLPPHAFATGSAVVNMLRQVGLAVGVAALIAGLAILHSPLATLIAYQRATWMVAAIAFVGGIVGLGLLAVKRQSSPIAAGETIAPAVAIVASGEAPRAWRAI
jgi:MFS family permease